MQEPIRESGPEPIRAERRAEGVPFRNPTVVNEVDTLNRLPNLVEWGSVWGGMFVSLGVLLLFSTLGVAIGLSSGATGAGIWELISLIIGFFVGGWFAGRTLEFADSLVAAAHGLLVWAVTLIFTLAFTIAAAFAGAGAAASVARAAFIGNLLRPFGVVLAPAAPNAAQAASTATTSSWVAFVVLLLGIIACIVGALVGNAERSGQIFRR